MDYGYFSKLPKDMLIKIIISGFNIKNLDLSQSIQLQSDLEEHISKLRTNLIKIHIINSLMDLPDYTKRIITVEEAKLVLNEIDDISMFDPLYPEMEEITLYFDENKYDAIINERGPKVYKRISIKSDEWDKLPCDKFYKFLMFEIKY